VPVGPAPENMAAVWKKRMPQPCIHCGVQTVFAFVLNCTHPQCRRINNDRTTRLREMEEHEALLATTCRLCPHCGVTIHKIDGCNSMLCGGDYHGGNLQTGCGRNFDWSTAVPYVAADLSALRTDLVHCHQFNCCDVPRCVANRRRLRGT